MVPCLDLMYSWRSTKRLDTNAETGKFHFYYTATPYNKLLIFIISLGGQNAAVTKNAKIKQLTLIYITKRTQNHNFWVRWKS